MEVILNSNIKETRNLAKDNFLIIWGGMKEVCKNESQKYIKQISNFVQNNLHTNVIVLKLPMRRDLVDHSSVNN
jgi:hypothetical protein